MSILYSCTRPALLGKTTHKQKAHTPMSKRRRGIGENYRGQQIFAAFIEPAADDTSGCSVDDRHENRIEKLDVACKRNLGKEVKFARVTKF